MILPGSSLFSPPRPSSHGAPPPPPSPMASDPAVGEAQRRTRAAALARRGRSSTILTSGQGVLGNDATPNRLG
mgnify:CR=1 FL=1